MQALQKTLNMEGDSAVPTGVESLFVRGRAGAAAHLADLILRMCWLLPSACGTNTEQEPT